MSNVYACAGIPIRTLFIVLWYLSILTKHTLTFQHNNLTINHTSKYHKVVTTREGEWKFRCSKFHAHCSDSQARCSDQLQHLGFLNPSLLIVAKTILAAASALYLNQPKHNTKNTIHCSQSEPARCSENHTCCSECSRLPTTFEQNPNSFSTQTTSTSSTLL